MRESSAIDYLQLMVDECRSMTESKVFFCTSIAVECRMQAMSSRPCSRSKRATPEKILSALCMTSNRSYM